MSRRREPRPSLRERTGKRLRYWLDESPSGIKDDWSEATSRAAFPVAALARFGIEHPEVSSKGSRRVQQALLQWLRIEGRRYPKQHAMPARSVEALMRMLRSDTDSWDDLRREWPVNLDYLFVHARGLWMSGDDLDPLRTTWSDAFNDEPPKSQTPLLFRVDADIGITDARTYQACCQGRSCNPPARVICLHAL